jgi:hypothetical protein
MKTKLRTYAKNVGAVDASAPIVAACGACNSRTMIVMMTASTPSLKASRRAVSVAKRII